MLYRLIPTPWGWSPSYWQLDMQLLITHLQGDQLSKAPPHIRKTAKSLDLTIINTDGVVWDVSKWDLSDWPEMKRRRSAYLGCRV